MSPSLGICWAVIGFSSGSQALKDAVSSRRIFLPQGLTLFLLRGKVLSFLALSVPNWRIYLFSNFSGNILMPDRRVIGGLLIDASSVWIPYLLGLHPGLRIHWQVASVLAQSCWTLCIAPSMGFSRQEYWNGLPFPPPGDLSNPEIELTPPVSHAIQADFSRLESLGKNTLTPN